MIEIKYVNKSYGSLKALNDVNLTLGKNKIIGLLGPNGSGKSTLIKLLNGLLKADNGVILVDGDLVGVETKKIISYLPERNYLDKNYTVNKMIAFFEDFYSDFNKEKALSMIKDLKIDPTVKIKTLSKGNIEKVQLILVMSRAAKYYILDEPIAGVDPATRDYIIETIMKNINKEATLIVSTHLIYEIEQILDEVIIIKEGNIIFQGEKDKLIENYESVDEWFRKEFRHV